VDEAIFLADKIMLMSNGPNACIAEIIDNTLVKPRDRHSVHHDPQYYRVRNHLIDFLVHRSRLYQTGEAARPEQPPIVRPGLEAPGDSTADRARNGSTVVQLRH
jgi:nitrate/nitrite transport system ATP-binding protein